MAVIDIEKLDDDEKLEMQIDIEYLKFATGKTANKRKHAWDRMNNLIKQRSPGKIRDMEERQNLI